MKKRLLTLLLAAGLMLTAFVPTHAANEELVNSTGSDATDITKGADTTQKQKTEYYPDLEVNTTTYINDVSVSVYATKGSMIKISSPKTLILGVGTKDTTTGKTPATGSCKIGLLGDLGGTQKIQVVYPTSVSMKDGTKTVTAAMTAIKSSFWTWDQVNPTTFTYETSTISIDNILAGAYKGVFNIHYEVTRN